MKLMKAEACQQDEAGNTGTGRNLGRVAVSAEADLAARTRTKAEAMPNLMEAVVERGNMRLAYQRVVENKGAGGCDGITVAELKDHLKQHWPTIKGRSAGG